MLKKIKLKVKLMLAFLLITFISASASTIFSILFFQGKITEEALQNIRKDSEVANLIYETKISEVSSFTESLSQDGIISFLIKNNPRKIKSELVNVVKREKVYFITVYTKYKGVITQMGLSTSSLLDVPEKINLSDVDIIDKAIEEKKTFTINELIPINKAYNLFSITSASPILEAEEGETNVLGVILVRYIINDHNEIVNQINNLLKVEAGIYQNEVGISKTKNSQLVESAYKQLLSGEKSYEEIQMQSDGILAQYKPLTDPDGEMIGVIGINESAAKYVKTRNEAMITLLLIMTACILVSAILGYFISQGIIVPVNRLLEEAKKISSGDLSNEIKLAVRDEIGKLGKTFDDMRANLKKNIDTIQEMNQNLENTVKQRTDTIESLLNKMKKYLSPQLYESIQGGKTDVKLTHARKKLTIFFSDIKSFTETTDRMEAEELSALLNNYLDEMANIAIKWGGTIDKFIGDAIMIFFGDPEFISHKEHALRAVKMSIEMREKLAELRQEWSSSGITLPLHVRIGVNTGYCTVGNFGSENRMDYTIIGSSVNLAARLESSAEPDSILISYETYALIKEDIECEYVGDIKVKGFHYPIKTYRVIKKIGDSENILHKQYIKRTKNGVLVNETLISPENMTDAEKQNLVKSLKIGIAYTEGRVFFDENGKLSKK